MYGTGMGDCNAHDPRNIPLVLAGGGAGQLKGGRHIRYPKETPLANLHLTLLDKLGVHLDRIGDSTGRLDDRALVGNLTIACAIAASSARCVARVPAARRRRWRPRTTCV